MTNKVLWIPQHDPTDEQMAELGRLFNFDQEQEVWCDYLKYVAPDIFSKLTNCGGDINEIAKMAADLTMICRPYRGIVLPIGSPAFMWVFSRNYRVGEGQRVLFAHSERVSEDIKQPDGTIKKVSVFKHKKFFVFED